MQNLFYVLTILVLGTLRSSKNHMSWLIFFLLTFFVKSSNTLILTYVYENYSSAQFVALLGTCHQFSNCQNLLSASANSDKFKIDVDHFANDKVQFSNLKKIIYYYTFKNYNCFFLCRI